MPPSTEAASTILDDMPKPNHAISKGANARRGRELPTVISGIGPARALAVRPEMLLMDEPCSALDPIATAKVEQLITGLAREVTVVLVTHNMFQAARVSDYVAVMLMGEDRVGELVEAGAADEVLHSPHDPRTLAYVTGDQSS